MSNELEKDNAHYGQSVIEKKESFTVLYYSLIFQYFAKEYQDESMLVSLSKTTSHIIGIRMMIKTRCVYHVIYLIYSTLHMLLVESFVSSAKRNLIETMC
jgi:hypothetical protein